MSLLRKKTKAFSGTIVALAEVMDKAIFNNLSEVVTMMLSVDGMANMIAGNIAIVPFAAFALFLGFLSAKGAKSDTGGFLKALLAGRWFNDENVVDRMFEERNISAIKTCPNCAEQLPISALICEACDFNFLSGIVGHGQRLLPPPEARLYEMSQRDFAYRA